jgi:hypothetical protein
LATAAKCWTAFVWYGVLSQTHQVLSHLGRRVQHGQDDAGTTEWPTPDVTIAILSAAAVTMLNRFALGPHAAHTFQFPTEFPKSNRISFNLEFSLPRIPNHRQSFIEVAIG